MRTAARPSDTPNVISIRRRLTSSLGVRSDTTDRRQILLHHRRMCEMGARHEAEAPILEGTIDGFPLFPSLNVADCDRCLHFL